MAKPKMAVAKPAGGGDLVFLYGGGETGELIAAYDWTATSLGPLRAWPQCLKGAIAILLQSALPMSLLWGEDGILIYNDAYAHLMGIRHPSALGKRAREVWPEHADLSDRVLRTGLEGKTVTLRDRELRIRRSSKWRQAWFNVDGSPVRDERGEPAGMLLISVETTQRVLAERKTALEFERQRRMFEQAPGLICLLSGPDLVVEYTNEAHKRLFGVRDAEGKPYMEAFAEIAARGNPEIFFKAYESGERHLLHAAPLVIPRPDGREEEHLLDVVIEPVSDGKGQVVGLFVEGFDVTEHVRARWSVEDSQRRLGAAVTIARLGTFEWYAETRAMILDARAREIFGFGPEESLTDADIFSRVSPDDLGRLEAEAAAAEALGEDRREYEFEIQRPDGAIRRIVSISGAFPASDGRKRYFGVFQDITERRAAERRQRMLINELNHRVKNTLATVQSIAAQTMRAAPDMESGKAAFEARLVALAGAHDLLNTQCWRGAFFADVAATATAAFARSPQISFCGPAIWLSAHQVLAFSLALHELATNALKHGALSTESGHVTASWDACGGEFTFRWEEEGGPPVAEPIRAGFGSRLLQRGLARELGGQVTWTLSPDGVRCEIRCAIERACGIGPVEAAEAAAAAFDF